MNLRVYISQNLSDKTIMQAVTERSKIFEEFCAVRKSPFKYELMKDAWYKELSGADIALIPHDYKANKWTNIEALIAMASNIEIYMYKYDAINNTASVEKYNYTRSK